MADGSWEVKSPNYGTETTPLSRSAPVSESLHVSQDPPLSKASTTSQMCILDDMHPCCSSLLHIPDVQPHCASQISKPTVHPRYTSLVHIPDVHPHCASLLYIQNVHPCCYPCCASQMCIPDVHTWCAFQMCIPDVHPRCAFPLCSCSGKSTFLGWSRPRNQASSEVPLSRSEKALPPLVKGRSQKRYREGETASFHCLSPLLAPWSASRLHLNFGIGNFVHTYD